MYHVLIADDHAVVRSGLAYLINQQPNFEVIDEAADGTSTYLRVEQGDVDILVMDLSGSLSTGVDEVIFRIQFIYELGSFFRF
jgi:two-component system response regulator NreC